MKYDIPAVLFAGGKSTRMGKDKALLPFAGYHSLSEYQYERLSKNFSHVYISAKENKFDFPVQLISDTYDESSPLVGIASVFETLEAEAVFILSVDAPFVNRSVIDALFKAQGESDAIIAKSESGRQPLCGIYKRTVLPCAQAQIEANDHKIGNLLKKVRTQFIEFEDDSLFINLNHPHEYEKALNALKDRSAVLL